jgi:hypothetical protein
MNVIDSNNLERDASGKAAQRSTFPHPAPGVQLAGKDRDFGTAFGRRFHPGHSPKRKAALAARL